MGQVRLDRRLVALRLGGRKEVQGLVRRGRVSVDGVVVRDPATKVDDAAPIALDGQAVSEIPLGVAWHKPVGVLTTTDDPWGRADLSSAVPELLALGLHPVGRLDLDTSGLLLWCSDGALTQALLHPRRAVPRTYVATVSQAPDDLAESLTRGVETSDGNFAATDVRVDERRVQLTVTEGKHRMVRRMLANAGAPCETLHRVAYGPVALGDLPEGSWRPWTEEEALAVMGMGKGDAKGV